MEPILDLDPGIVERATSIRRRIHAHPELSFEETETARLVADELAGTSAEIRTGIASTGVVARFIRDPALPTIALRADMDALPIAEVSGVPHASRNPGVMHACGHDGHTAVLVGVAHLLDSIRESVPGNVTLVFQPAEENGGGGEKMVEAGVLDDPPVFAALALHAWPHLDAGHVGVGSGPILASTDGFRCTITGPGGHGAHPDLAVDTILAAARVIDALHTIVSREVDPLEPVVVSIGRIHGGAAGNVIPDHVEFAGTIRCLREELRPFVRQRIADIAHHVAAAHRAEAEVALSEGYPVTRNDPGLVERFIDRSRLVIGADRVHRLERPSMGGEDFSYYGRNVPAVMFRLGVCIPGDPDSPSLHTPRFDFNDAAIPTGILTLANAALDLLSSPPAVAS